MKSKKIIYLVLGGILVLSFCVSSAMAAEFRAAGKGGNVTISQEEKVRNLYTAGNMISIEGDIEKSLHAAGNVITIGGDVENNIYAVGNTIVIRGKVGDSVHVGGSNIVIEGEIKEDLFLAGGNIALSKSASVGGDLVVAGGTVEIASPVTGDVYLAGGQVTINSKIGGQVRAKVDELNLGSQAEIAKNLSYRSPKEVSMAEGAKVLGEISFEKKVIKKIKPFKSPKTLFGILTLSFLIKLLATIAAGLVLIYLFRNLTERTIKEGLAHFWANLGRGFSALILTPIACIILLVTVVGAWLAGLIGVAYTLMVLLSLVLASIAFGSWLIKVFKKRSEYLINWPAVVWGVIVLNLIVLVPYLGWVVGLIFMLISLGALYRLVYQSLVSRK